MKDVMIKGEELRKQGGSVDGGEVEDLQPLPWKIFLEGGKHYELEIDIMKHYHFKRPNT